MRLIVNIFLHKNSNVRGFCNVDSRESIAESANSYEGQNESKIVIDASLLNKDKLACGFSKLHCAEFGIGFDPAFGALASCKVIIGM